MDPKEKAKELVLQFSDIGLIVSSEAKQCALIAVDELINESQFEVTNFRQRYWQEVKTEIENYESKN